MGEIGTVAGILVFILVVVILIVLASCIKIVPQAQAMVVERLGAYDSTWGVGIHFKVPILKGAGGGFRSPAGNHKGQCYHAD